MNENTELDWEMTELREQLEIEEHVTTTLSRILAEISIAIFGDEHISVRTTSELPEKVRELVKDRERLNWVVKSDHESSGQYRFDGGSFFDDPRLAIDAAMKGGE